MRFDMTARQFEGALREVARECSEEYDSLSLDYSRGYAWGPAFVYFIEEYDGHESVRAVPRNPVDSRKC